MAYKVTYRFQFRYRRAMLRVYGLVLSSSPELKFIGQGFAPYKWLLFMPLYALKVQRFDRILFLSRL